MNVKLLIGIALFLIGMVAAVMGIVGVGGESDAAEQSLVAAEGTAAETEPAGGRYAPIFAGLALASGGLLMGLSLGNWRNPRTTLEAGDEVVNPEGYTKMKHV